MRRITVMLCIFTLIGVNTVSASESIAQQTETTYENYNKLKTLVDVGYFLENYVVSGGVVAKDVTYNNKISVTHLVASLDSDVTRHEAVSFTTTVAGTTYYLDYKTGGEYSFATSHPTGSYLPVAEVTTDSNKNVAGITDKRGDTGGFRLLPGYTYPEIAKLDAGFPFCQKLFAKLERGESGTLVFLGDSTTQLNETTNFQKNHVGMIEDDLKALYGSNITVINSGVGGDDTNEMWQRLYRDVLKHNPDAVVICSGLNDAAVPFSNSEYFSYYRNIVEQILTYCGTDTDIVCRTPNMYPSDTLANQILEGYVKEVRKICNIYGLTFVDFYTYQKGQVTQGKIDNTTLYTDNVHPNVAGHTVIYNFLKGFIKANNRPFVRNSNITLFDTKHPLINKVQFFDDTSDNYANGTALGSSAIGAKLTVKFYGTGISFHYLKTVDRGILKVTVDGTVVNAGLDMYLLGTSWVNQYDVLGLASGSHVLELEVLSTKNPASQGNIATIMGFIVRDVNGVGHIIKRETWENEKKYDYVNLGSGSGYKTTSDGFMQQWGGRVFDVGETVINFSAPYTQLFGMQISKVSTDETINSTVKTYDASSFTIKTDKPVWIDWLAYGLK